MIQLFARNTHFNVFVLFIYALILRFGAYFIADYSLLNQESWGPIGDQITKLILKLPYLQITGAILSFILVFIQALYVNYVFDHIKLYPKGGYLPAFTYILVASLIPELVILSPLLIVASFLPFIVQQFHSIQGPKLDGGIPIDLGISLSLIVLVCVPFILAIPFILVIFLVKKPLNLQNWMRFMVGLVVPIFLTVTGFYFFDALDIFSAQFSIGRFFRFSLTSDKVVLILFLVLFIGALIILQEQWFKNAIQFRGYHAVVGFTFLGMLLASLWGSWVFLQLLIFPFAVFFVPLWNKYAGKFRAELLHLVLFLTVILTQVLTIFNLV